MAGGEGGQEERGGGKGGEEEPEERTDGWMTTYSDMVTLLMTFFVLMFAISNVDNQKAMLFFAGMSRDGLSTTQFEQIVEMFNPGDDPGAVFLPYGSWDDDEDGGSPDSGEEGNEELTDLYEVMLIFLETTGLGVHIQLQFDGEFLLMTLANDILFDLGRANIRPEMAYVGSRIAELIAGTHNPDNPFDIVVSGHTDDWPINTVEFPSNWHVSVARAVNFMSVLLHESGIDPQYFQARGMGEYHPIDTNETYEGRQRNRRVEVKVTTARSAAGISPGGVPSGATYS